MDVGKSAQSMLALVAVAATSISVVACGSPGAPVVQRGRIFVVAAENVWGDIARQIGGSYVQVASIISNPNTDPHLYQTNAQAAIDIGTARLVIENGLDYDDFVDKIVAAGSHTSRRVLDVARVIGVGGGNPNPHLWYDTAGLPKVAASIAQQLAAIDPAHAEAFSAGAARFDASLRPLRSAVATIKAKYAGTPIGYTERVAGYLVQAAGLVPASPAGFAQAIEDGNDPSLQDTVRFDRDISTGRVKVLLYNAQVVDAQTAAIKRLAVAHGVPIVGMSEMLPSIDVDFQMWQLRQDTELLRALGG